MRSFVCEKPTIKLQNRSRAKSNYSDKKRSNDFVELSKLIPKQIKSINLITEDIFDLATKCAIVLKKLNKEAYNALEFDGNEHIDEVVNTLVQTLVDNTIVTSIMFDVDVKDYLFLYDVEFDSRSFYILQGKYINYLPYELKVGYAHLVNQFQRDLFNSQFQYSGTKDDSLFENEFEMYQDYEDFQNENEELSDEYKCDYAEIVEKHISNTIAIMKEVMTYKSVNMDVFTDFEPKDKTQERIKKAIQSIFNLNAFGCWNAFVDSKHEDDEISFLSFFWAVTDFQDEIENRHIVDYETHIYEIGCTYPNGYYMISNNKVINPTTKKKCKNLTQFCKLFDKLNLILYKNYGK